ncbi:hypothetical protein IE53DRAFT_371866 [Violaceomyces palustris]|uniref:Uncharacterized protein n=1 Tax=Violaceomyces palustris TaxID=1673888 RepID=A0ACD0NMB1_9BASI|nr:hypothetical protein IE53DRAFT_371866 [Violaceomyces palustris]
MKLSKALILISSLVLPIYAFDLKAQIQPNDHLKDLIFLGSTTRALLRTIPTDPSDPTNSNSPFQTPQDLGLEDLDGSEAHDRSAYVARDGSFLVKDLKRGSYTLEIISKTNTFPKYRVDVLDDAKDSPNGKAVQIRMHTPGTSLQSTLTLPKQMHPLIIYSNSRNEFFQEKQGFNVSALLSNPMMLLAGASMVLVFVLPKITASLDPETQAELKASQETMSRRMNAIQSGDVQSLIWNQEYAKKGEEREKLANQDRARRNLGPKAGGAK